MVSHCFLTEGASWFINGWRTSVQWHTIPGGQDVHLTNDTVCINHWIGLLLEKLNLKHVKDSRCHVNTSHSLKTLFNIVEAPLKKLLNYDVCVAQYMYVWWCSDGPINSQEYKSFVIYAITIKISMTEYHHWINGQVYHLFY